LTQYLWSNDAGGAASTVVFSPDGRRVIAAVSTDAGGIRGWDAKSGHSDLAILQGGPISGIALPPDPQRREIFAGSGNNIVRWSFIQEAARGGSPRVKGEIGSLAWGGSQSDKHVLAVQIKPHSPDRQGRLVLFNENLAEMAFDMVGNRDVLSVCFLGTSGLMATGSTDTKVRLWAVNTLDYSHGYPLMSTIDNDVAVYSLASSSDGSIIAAGGRVSAQFFQANGRKISKVFRPNHDCRSLALSPDGMTAAVGSGSDGAGDVTIYDVNSGEMAAELTGFGGAVESLAFSPDGSLLATGSSDHAVKAWDLRKLLPDRAAASPATRPAGRNSSQGNQ
jgi:WD40 repeat protein